MATSLTSTSTAAKACSGCGLVVCAGCGGGLLLSGSESKEYQQETKQSQSQPQKKPASNVAKLFTIASTNPNKYGEGTMGRAYGDKLLSVDNSAREEWKKSISRLDSNDISPNPSEQFKKIRDEHKKNQQTQIKSLQEICDKMYQAHKTTWDALKNKESGYIDEQTSLVKDIWKFCSHSDYWDKMEDKWLIDWGVKKPE